MAELAVLTKQLDFHLEQVQDFTPTPMTVATETWYTGYDPYTLEPVFSAKSQRDKLAQRQYFFWYKPEERRGIEQSLRRIGRPDLIQELCPLTSHHSSLTSKPQNLNNSRYHPSPSNDNHRASHRPERPQEEKRGRHRRNR